MRCDRLVHLVVFGKLAVIEIGRERHEPSGGKAIGHLLDSRIEAPPLLDDQHAGARTGRRRREIPGGHASVAAELDGVGHARKNNLTEF